MSESAITVSKRSPRRQLVAAELTAVARRWTATDGINGFTVEELCAEVGISRRTFFNYFASKDDAVLGIDEGEEIERLSAAFLDLGSRGWPAVLEDLVALLAEHADHAGFRPREHADFFQALEREPRLLTRFIGLNREREQMLRELVAHREGVPSDDPRAAMTVQVVGIMLHSAGQQMLDDADGADFRALLDGSLAAIRAVTAIPAPHETETNVHD